MLLIWLMTLAAAWQSIYGAWKVNLSETQLKLNFLQKGCTDYFDGCSTSRKIETANIAGRALKITCIALLEKCVSYCQRIWGAETRSEQRVINNDQWKRPSAPLELLEQLLDQTIKGGYFASNWVVKLTARAADTKNYKTYKFPETEVENWKTGGIVDQEVINNDSTPLFALLHCVIMLVIGKN